MDLSLYSLQNILSCPSARTYAHCRIHHPVLYFYGSWFEIWRNSLLIKFFFLSLWVPYSFSNLIRPSKAHKQGKHSEATEEKRRRSLPSPRPGQWMLSSYQPGVIDRPEKMELQPLISSAVVRGSVPLWRHKGLLAVINSWAVFLVWHRKCTAHRPAQWIYSSLQQLQYSTWCVKANRLGLTLPQSGPYTFSILFTW